MKNIKKGQVYYAKLPIYRDGHQVVYPVLIIQNSGLNYTGTITVVPISKKEKNYQSNILELELENFSKIMPNSIFLFNSIISISKENINGYITMLSRSDMKRVNELLKLIFNIYT